MVDKYWLRASFRVQVTTTRFPQPQHSLSSEAGPSHRRSRRDDFPRVRSGANVNCNGSAAIASRFGRAASPGAMAARRAALEEAARVVSLASEMKHYTFLVAKFCKLDQTTLFFQLNAQNFLYLQHILWSVIWQN
ncbi:unnamed protein product [Protopolystoma xenopodis]|uniref:Uncharacterized protein n=1 Tax=Protopolystoma xenopodis TaxID=117903 RepID=A0A3S5FFI8_9PLAT|nr:unnamed protein product [Protopolystoma xenopodis]